MTGYIKDHRKELNSDIWLMPPLYHRVWQWLKYSVNHSDNEIPLRDGTRMLIKRGQRLTSVRDIAKDIGWYEGRKKREPNPKTISAILDWMEKTSMITIERGKGNREYTLITLVNYEVYNSKESEGNRKETPDGAGGKHLADINKNEKNEKKKHYAEFVTMTETEYGKLVSQHGEEFTRKCIEVLDNYKGAKKKKYASDYRAILTWVVEKVSEKGNRPGKTIIPLPTVKVTDEERAILAEVNRKQAERNGVSFANSE